MRERWRTCLETVRTNSWAVILRRRTGPQRARLGAVLAACMIAGLALGAGAVLLRPPVGEETPVPAVLLPSLVPVSEMQPAPEVTAGPVEWVRPVSGDIVGEFGWRWNSLYRDWRLHRGVDLAAVAGEAVAAVGPGTVVGVELEPSRMYRVIIDHPGLGQVSYCNLDTVTAVPGGEVSGGDVVGMVGECLPYLGGLGPHLRLELYVGGTWTDPRPVVDGTGRLGENR